MGTGWRMCNQPCLDDCQLCKWLSHVQKQRKLTGWRNENDARGGRNQAARRHHPTPYYSHSKYASIWFGHIFFHYYVNFKEMYWAAGIVLVSPLIGKHSPRYASECMITYLWYTWLSEEKNVLVPLNSLTLLKRKLWCSFEMGFWYDLYM